MNKRKKRKLNKEKRLERMVLKTYYDFSNPGSYGSLQRLQKATGVPVKKLKSIMQKNLIYSLHKPVRVRYTRNPTVANSIDHQWAADLADMKNLSRYNRGVKYLLTVVDVLSKYAWVVPMKNKTGAEQMENGGSIEKWRLDWKMEARLRNRASFVVEWQTRYRGRFRSRVFGVVYQKP